MASQKTTTTNPFSVLSPEEDMPSLQIPSDQDTAEPSRRQQKKAVKAEAAKAKAKEEAKSAAAAAAAQKAEEKPAGWKASLTMAQIKALKQEEGLKKHYAMHPPKAAADKAVVKGASNDGPAQGNSNGSYTGKGKGKAPQYNDYLKPHPENQQPIVPGCGLEGCIVKDRHPARPYTVDDYNLPSYIKTLYFQWPSPRDMEKVEQFFKVHEETAAKVVKWTTKW